MTTIDDGGPAFPGSANQNNEYSDTMHRGMSLRAWLAGQALVGLLSEVSDGSGGFPRDDPRKPYEGAKETYTDMRRAEIKRYATDACALADAVIAALKAAP